MRRLVVAFLVATLGIASATDWASRTDLEIVALDAHTGKVMWHAKVGSLGTAHFALRHDALIVFPRSDDGHPSYLDPKTGAPTTPSRRPQKLLAQSSWPWAGGEVRLGNGWQLIGFSPGNTKDLTFFKPFETKPVWTVHALDYPEVVLAYQDLALHAYGYLTHQAVIYAHAFGATTPAWSLDFNQLLHTTGSDRLGRVSMQIIGDVLYAQSGEHVFAIEPMTGKVLWQTGAAKVTQLRYAPDLYGGALDLAVFARDRDVLVVAFDKRVLALDAATGKLLWHLAPDTFPHTAFPIVAEGVVYLTAGPKRTTP